MDYANLLLEACGNGELEAVKIIVGGLEVDVDETATYNFTSSASATPSAETIEIVGASPLFVAAGNCNLAITNYLIRRGANVNSRTNERGKYSGMTPLHAAVSLRQDINWFQKRAIIELLIANGADALAIDSSGFSMWMLCYEANIGSHLLVDLAVSLTQQFPGKNFGALHHWASSHGYGSSLDQDAVRIIELLLSKGADLKARDAHGLTPLNVAAVGYPRPRNDSGECPNAPVLTYLLGREEVSVLEMVDAIELAGATLLLHHDDEEDDESQLLLALDCWNVALNLRESAQESIPKIPLKSNTTVHWRAAEWTTREELEELKNRPLNEMQIQAVLVARRILSSISSKALVFHLWYSFMRDHYMTLFIRHQYTELLEMCCIIFEGARGTGRCDDKLWFVIVESTFLLVDSLEKLKGLHSPIFNLETMKLSLELVFETSYRSPRHRARHPSYKTSTFFNPMKQIFKLVALLVETPDMVTHEIKCMLHQFVMRDIRLGYFGFNLLHETCARKPTAVTLAIARLLLEVGADPDANDRVGNSPLHHVAMWMEEAETSSPTADLLLKLHAHLDQRTILGRTPLDVWKVRHARSGRVLSPPAWMNPVLPLSCWSARSIHRSRIRHGKVPKMYRHFVSMH